MINNVPKNVPVFFVLEFLKPKSFLSHSCHAFLGFRERLLKDPEETLGKNEYDRFEDAFIILLADPRQQYHGGATLEINQRS